MRQEGWATVWIRKIEEGASTRIAGPFDALIPWLQFTRNGADLAFYTMALNGHSGNLYVVPSAGGEVRVLRTGVSAPMAISADEIRFAYTRDAADGSAGELVLLEPGGDGCCIAAFARRSMSTFLRRYSHRMAGVSCVRCGVRETSGFGVRLEIVDLDGSSRLLRSIVWQSVSQVAWSKNPEGLFVAGQDFDSAFPQLWRLKLDGSSATRVTNDLHSYTAVSLDAAGGALVAVQAQSTSNLYRRAANESASPVQITTGSDAISMSPGARRAGSCMPATRRAPPKSGGPTPPATIRAS